MTRANHNEDGESLSAIIARTLETGIANARIVDEYPDEPASPLFPRAELEKLGWPTRALDKAERANEAAEGIAAVRAFDAPGILVLSGDKGCGKTVASAWWAMRRHAGARFIRAGEFAAQSRYGVERKEILASRSLVFDDLGTEYADDKGAFVADLDMLIDIAYSDARRLIITTNLTGKAIGERYGERISDRFAECGEWAPLKGLSMRART